MKPLYSSNKDFHTFILGSRKYFKLLRWCSPLYLIFMCYSKKSIGFIFLGISGAMSLIGITCWVIGSMQPNYSTSKILISIPVFPTTKDGMSYWVSTKYNNESQTYSNSEPLNFDIDLSKYDQTQNFMTFYLIHNMYYINTSINFITSTKSVLESQSINTTYSYTNETYTNINQNINLLTHDLKKDGFYKVYCPHSTLITQNSGIEPLCNRSTGYPMKIYHNFTATEVFSIKLHDHIQQFTLNIPYGRFIPFNYIHTPQIYFAAWQQTKSADVTLSGAIITAGGFLVLTASIGIFISMIVEAFP